MRTRNGPFPRSSGTRSAKSVDALKHNEATRINIPTAEMESFFRREEGDTWKDGIHSYLTHLRDRLTVMRGLLTESGLSKATRNYNLAQATQ